ncbi:hypothetical protein, partial [Faecalibaculum rodentium]|uniref:hypothetical protein n=1 Tax=Faecalibaculum rodentium TaxID=1702221 RepID=UPI0025A01F65
LALFVRDKPLTELGSLSSKDNVDLKIVEPAYTSKKAKETVCRELGINVHLGAACMIARRGLGLF